MKVFKKNQIITFTIGLMVLTAGYLNFTNNKADSFLQTGTVADSEEIAGIGDAKLVSANVASENEVTDESKEQKEESTNTDKIDSVDEKSQNINDQTKNDEKDKKNEGTNYANEDEIETDGKVLNADEYFMNSRLERNTMYSQQIENYQCILDNTNVSETQKKIAQEEITRISNEQNAIMIAENLIKAKGIEDLVIFINEDSVNVIIKGKETKKEEIAQIQNIVTRELKTDIENVHIMNK